MRNLEDILIDAASALIAASLLIYFIMIPNGGEWTIAAAGMAALLWALTLARMILLGSGDNLK